MRRLHLADYIAQNADSPNDDRAPVLVLGLTSLCSCINQSLGIFCNTEDVQCLDLFGGRGSVEAGFSLDLNQHHVQKRVCFFRSYFEAAWDTNRPWLTFLCPRALTSILNQSSCLGITSIWPTGRTTICSQCKEPTSAVAGFCL